MLHNANGGNAHLALVRGAGDMMCEAERAVPFIHSRYFALASKNCFKELEYGLLTPQLVVFKILVSLFVLNMLRERREVDRVGRN